MRWRAFEGEPHAVSSRRQAAQRFGVGPASAICWHKRFREEGAIAPKASGGERTPPVIEAHAEQILEICRKRPQIFLRALRDTLAGQGGRTSTSGL